MSIEFWTQVHSCKEKSEIAVGLQTLNPWFMLRYFNCFDSWNILQQRNQRKIHVYSINAESFADKDHIVVVVVVLTSPVVLPVWYNENDKYLLLESPHKSTNSNSKGTVVVLNYILRENFQGRCALFFSIHIHSMT